MPSKRERIIPPFAKGDTLPVPPFGKGDTPPVPPFRKGGLGGISQKLIVGLTGGIGSGKSTVARCFAKLGVEIIDADEIARDVVKPGTAALAAILNHFGPRVLTAQGTLDRAALSVIVFQKESERAWLEALLHPLICSQMELAIQNLTGPYGVVVIPLLVERGEYTRLDQILVVDLPEALQIKRVMQRDGVDEAQVRSILKTQATRQQRLAVANDVILNDGDLPCLEQQVLALHQKYTDCVSFTST